MTIERLCQSAPCTLTPEASALEAARLMRERGIGSVIVATDGCPVGVVTDRDLALKLLCARLDPATTPVEMIMQRPVAALPLGASVAEATAQMRKAKVRRLPVVTATGKLVGVVAHDTLVVTLAERLRRVRIAIQKQLL